MKYIDEARGVTFLLEPTTGEVTLVEEGHSHAHEDLKNDLTEALTSYVGEEYSEGKCVPTVFIDGEDELTIRINLSCHNLNLKNFWGGEWISTWDVSHTVGSDSFSLVGRIRIHNHYFEQGNINFDLSKNYAEAATGSAVGGSIGKGITELIGQLEGEYHKSLENVYSELKDTHLRNLRRRLPFTGQQFNWTTPKLI